MATRVTPAFRVRLSEKFMDLGNFVAVAMVIGQFVGGKEFSIPIFFAGLVISILSYIIAYMVSS